jgi:hypothetical protein
MNAADHWSYADLLRFELGALGGEVRSFFLDLRSGEAQPANRLAQR